jgi:hypothetical protein
MHMRCLALSTAVLLQKQGRQDVYFAGVAIFPKNSGDSERWVAALKEHNSTMVRLARQCTPQPKRRRLPGVRHISKETFCLR